VPLSRPSLHRICFTLRFFVGFDGVINDKQIAVQRFQIIHAIQRCGDWDTFWIPSDAEPPDLHRSRHRWSYLRGGLSPLRLRKPELRAARRPAV
jgi:hypothetical protein